MIEVGELTKNLLSHLESVGGGLLVGDGIAPFDGGWLEGQPNVSAFRPYTVLQGGQAAPMQRDRMVPSESEWQVTYQTRTFSGSTTQLRTYAQKVRNVVTAYADPFGVADVFNVVHTHCAQLGMEQRNDAVDPPYWSVTDAWRIEVSRSRSQP